MPNLEDILGGKILTLSQTLILASGIISATYTVTSIYNRFELLVQNEERIEEKIDYVDQRVTKITGRNKDKIELLEDRIHSLENKTN